MNNNISYKTLCLLEDLNDVLHEGRLENDDHMDQIVYQCQRLIDITN